MMTAIPKAIIKYSPAVRLNQSLTEVTKTRREALRKDFYLSPVNGFGVYNALAPTDALARLRTEPLVKRVMIGCAAGIAGLAQATTYFAAGPLLGAYVLAVWLMRGKEKMLDCAAKHLLPIVVSAHIIETTFTAGVLASLMLFLQR